MLTASTMELLSMVVFKEKADDVLSHLLELGIFHPVDIRRIEEDLRGLSLLEIQKEIAQWDVLESGLKEILRKLNLTFQASGAERQFTAGQIQEELKYIDEKLASLLARKEELQEDLKTKKNMVSQIGENSFFTFKKLSNYSFLEVSFGKIEEKNIAVLERSLAEIPHITYPFKKEGSYVTALVIGLRRDRAVIDRVLTDLFWKRVDYPEDAQNLSKEAVGKIASQIEEEKKELSIINEDIKTIANDSRDLINLMYSYIMLKKTVLEAKRYICATEKTVLLSGWVPSQEKERVIERIKKIASETAIESRKPVEVNIPKEEVPVQLIHGPLFKPFELLITSYGLPRYGSIDPTIFVAVSFLIMFGAMFGDLGHGLFLVLSSIFLRKINKEKIRQAAALIFYCGLSSCLFGLLYGSVFGLEFHSFWAKPMDDIMGVFKVSVIFGIGIISIGILINMLNALKDRDYLKAVLDKAGLIGGILYWAAIGVVIKIFVVKGQVPAYYFGVIISGLLLLFLRPILENFFRINKESFFEVLIKGMVEVLEVFMGYLANTVSFIRIAAFSLAHAGLFLAIFELARLVKGVGGGALSLMVIVLGNFFVILLEGLVVSIQSLRLNYYEFFSKFFLTGKNVFKPISI